MVRASKRQKLQKRSLGNEQVDMSMNESNDDSVESNVNVESLTDKECSNNCHHIIIQQKLDVALNRIQRMTQEIRSLVNEVSDLKTEMHNIKNELFDCQQIEDVKTKGEELIVDPSPLNNDTPPITGPFPKYEPINRVFPRPSSKDIVNTLGGKTHSLQFTCNLYVDLIEKILGPAENSNLDYRAMVKEAILVTKAVLSDLKELHNIDSNLRWSHVDPTIKLEAYRKLENATVHLLPLKVCSEFWGAHVLISNFWLKRKKSSSTTTKTKKQQEQKINSKPFSIPFLTHQ